MGLRSFLSRRESLLETPGEDGAGGEWKSVKEKSALPRCSSSWGWLRFLIASSGLPGSGREQGWGRGSRPVPSWRCRARVPAPLWGEEGSGRRNLGFLAWFVAPA